LPLNLESLSDDAKTPYLARIAHTLTICARDTYEFGTENVLNPQMLRAYNELLHQVIGSVISRLAGSQESVQSTVELIRLFGVEQDRVEEINWTLKYALQRCTRVPDQTTCPVCALIRHMVRYPETLLQKVISKH
jgi:hypothetical protein